MARRSGSKSPTLTGPRQKKRKHKPNRPSLAPRVRMYAVASAWGEEIVYPA